MKYNTLLLDRTEWDLILDINGNIAMGTAPYSISQDVASALKLFKGELWYDTSKGVPYLSNILGQYPSKSILIEYISKAVKSVPGVKSIKSIDIKKDPKENVGIEIKFIDYTGVSNDVYI